MSTLPLWSWLLLISFAMAFGWILGHTFGYRKGFQEARWIVSLRGSKPYLRGSKL